MTVTILAYDIPGSTITHNVSKDYRQHKAVRKFLVSSTTETKAAVITAVQTGLPTTHPQTSGVTDSNLPLQTLNAKKVGRGRWIVEAQYYYPF